MTYASPGGNGDKIRGYLVQPAGNGPWPAVLVIHENRGLNPYIEDVARRAAVEGFLALAPDGLSPLGGYPGNDDDGRAMQAKLDQAKLRQDMLNGAKWLKAHELSTKKLGATGFCWGGGTTNFLAAALGSDLQAGAPYYGVAAETARGAEDQGAAARSPRRAGSARQRDVCDLRAGAEEGRRAHEIHMYPGTQHGFHNNSTPRFSEAAAKLSWERTIAFFKKNLA